MTTVLAIKEMHRGQALALATQGCAHCFGLGLCAMRSETLRPCNCVWRAVFRACFHRFASIVKREKSAFGNSMRQVAQLGSGGVSGPQGKASNSRQYIQEEYAADFLLIAKRTLGEESAAYQIFKFHFLLGADWKACCRRLGVDRGNFFHAVYRIQQTLGRAFYETAPYGIFPLDEYFGGVVNSAKTTAPAPAAAAAATNAAGRSLFSGCAAVAVAKN